MTDGKGTVTAVRPGGRSSPSGPTPVGGKLVDRVLEDSRRARAVDQAARVPKLALTPG